MYDKGNLVKKFAEAGLTLEFGLVNRSNREIFGVKVDRKVGGNLRDEWFVMQPGHESNTIRVIDVNKKYHQVLIQVKEEKREFFTVGYKGKKQRHTTSASTRKFLLGLDERQLFMCQVNSRSRTVDHAHELLKAPNLVTAEGKVGRATRQGEWFFIKPTDWEQKEIEKAIAKHLIMKKIPIGADSSGRGVSGNPHTADETLFIKGKPLKHGWPVRDREIFVRGKIRHKDHKTIEFKSWRKVLRNTESRESQVGTWID